MNKSDMAMTDVAISAPTPVVSVSSRACGGFAVEGTGWREAATDSRVFEPRQVDW